MVLFTLTVFDFWLDIVGSLTKKLKMENIKSEPVDFVKEFQEYLTQQTQHVNMISGSVCGEKDPDDSFHAVTSGNVGEYRGADPPSVEVSLALEDGAELQMDGLERTLDGKYKCSYCNYANKGMARLIEHIRIHTGEKPHRCQLCPFASAYERHLEAHMRSHTGEKPYKCDLCAFRCSDRSNLSHHRRRRHKLLPVRGVRSPFSNKRMLSVLQKRTSSLGFGRRLLLNLSPPSMVPPKPDHLSDLSRDLHHHLNNNEYKNSAKVHERDSSIRSANGLTVDNPLDQLSALAGQLANLPPHPQSPGSPDRLSSEDEKPILVQQASGPPVALSTNGVQTMPLKDPCPSVHSDEAAPASTTQDQLLSHKCQHCDIQFSDNILYTIHMGCHGYEHPFQCNICGCICRDKYDFACHFARGHLKK